MWYCLIILVIFWLLRIVKQSGDINIQSTCYAWPWKYLHIIRAFQSYDRAVCHISATSRPFFCTVNDTLVKKIHSGFKIRANCFSSVLHSVTVFLSLSFCHCHSAHILFCSWKQKSNAEETEEMVLNCRLTVVHSRVVKVWFIF